MEGNGSWLCPTARDRGRLLGTSAGARRADRAAGAATGVALLASIPWLGWLPLVLGVLSIVNVVAIERLIVRSARPELLCAGSVLFSQLLVGGGVALTGGAASPLLPWAALPALAAATRFPHRVAIGYIAVALLTVLGAALAVDPAGVAGDPTLLLATAALVVGVATSVMVLQRAEPQRREDAVIDQLTGLLNREALVARFTELEQQARQSEASVCVIAADLDDFRKVNDAHGRARGDDVLREVTSEMRKRLRTFELMYRLGGEELLVVLPGVDLPEGVAVAERLRRAVAESRPAGLEQTISLGVAAECGSEATRARLLEAADRALHAAKQAGRNAVRADGHGDIAPLLEQLGVIAA